jgi:hypothetical protein
MGLSIGVHLLNLLTIPAIVMVYYFRKRNEFNYAVLRKWFIRLAVIGGVIGFIGALVMANGEANPERGVGMDARCNSCRLNYFRNGCGDRTFNFD